MDCYQITTNLHNKRPVKLDTEEKKAIKDLQDNAEIIILPADKGRTTVIMNKSDYIEKANTLLRDTEDKDKLEEASYNRIRPNDASTAKFYGLPKIHKEKIPLPPIVSLPGSPTYELSKYLAMILQPLVKTSPHTINNTNAFLTIILKILNLNLTKS